MKYKFWYFGLLESRISSLEERLSKLEQDTTSEIIEQDVQRRTVQCSKTPNQLRKEIIEKAKKFVELYETDDTKYEIVEETRRIIAYELVFKNDGSVDVNTGVAQCNEKDVYNEDIGKAIAVGRLRNKDVSEFENAVQPTYTAGQVISYITNDTEKIRRISYVNGTELRFENENYIHSDRDKRYGLDKPKIIDDTNAEY